MLRYSLLRLLIFFGCVSALWLLGLRDREDALLLVVGAALLSAVISYFALRRFREDYSAQVAHKLEERAAAKRDAPPTRSADEEAEDAEVSGDEGTFR
jgi:type II secretory pathway component PulM